MASNLILSLLSKEFLTGENFMKSKSNINIVLIGNNTKFVMIKNKPNIPDENATKSVRERYERWHIANNKVKAYMLASMSDTLRTKLENVDTHFDIMGQLQDMFEHKSDEACFKATKKYVNVKLAS
ncbi:uncharacterized protein LOC133814882 [Humulus lupulus]|uniref:uncharacterized protein LOC133814882 n=1 Tax=Humulus lupulus TaxID=3486 RepID=UPI002B407DD4|nr:uncharacterized protein LOC133814882 [Humulus lupulus]